MEFSVRNAADLGAAIQTSRSNAAMTQAELAERALVSRSYLAKVEAGRTSRLLELLLDLLRILDLELVIRTRGSHRG